MAKVNQRLWVIPGQRTKHKAWGFTAQVGGKQVRRYRAEWSREDAEAELAKALLQVEQPPAARLTLTFGEAVERYLSAKSRKRSVAADRMFLTAFKSYFGAETALTDITASRISAWKSDRLAAICPRTKRQYSAAAVNRPLAALRHLLQLAHDEWEVLPTVPRIRFEKEPQGRIRWLEPDEETRLMEACRGSRAKGLAAVVRIALETGLRKSEVLGLTWDRVDLSRGVIRLELTKSDRRREIPMRQAVYDVLAALPEPHTGRLWNQRNIRTAFESAVEAAGIVNFRFHDMRHHFSSWFMMRGGSLHALKELLGHSDIKTTLIYAHLSPAHLRSEIARTERRDDDAAPIAQASTHEVVGRAVSLEGVR